MTKMAPIPKPPVNTSAAVKPPKPRPPVCFSFAAYSKTVIRHLRSLNVAVSTGLSDDEISAVESSLGFSFPPDLRSILQSGLPLGTHFPDWRSGSIRHLRVLFNLPLLHLSKNVVRNGFWVGSWGPRPENDVAAQSIVKKLTAHAPCLVPVYGNFYVPSTSPNLAGNPVLQIDGNGVRVLSFDVAGFFQRFDRFPQMDFGFDFSIFDRRKISGELSQSLPAWAATEARRVEFWTDVAEGGRISTARGPTRGWWSASPDECLRECLDDAFWTLRDGGWGEDEIRDTMNGHDAVISGGTHDGIRHVIQRRIDDAAQKLSRAGWSRDDVAYALESETRGCGDRDRDRDCDHRESHAGARQLRLSTSCCVEEEDHQKRGEITTLMYLLSLEA